jgi:hypothetical protein
MRCVSSGQMRVSHYETSRFLQSLFEEKLDTSHHPKNNTGCELKRTGVTLRQVGARPDRLSPPFSFQDCPSSLILIDPGSSRYTEQAE